MSKLVEEWRPIEGFEGLYEVSNLGNVKSVERYVFHLRYGKKFIKEKIRKPIDSGIGYLQVVLFKNGKRKNHLVHRLVAEAFISNPNNLPQVNHKDEDKTNNNVNNLEWCTSKYNNNYGTAKARISEKHINHPSMSKVVFQYTLNGKLIAEFPSTHEAERRTGVNRGNICSCCRGNYKSAGGYKWKYA